MLSLGNLPCHLPLAIGVNQRTGAQPSRQLLGIKPDGAGDSKEGNPSTGRHFVDVLWRNFEQFRNLSCLEHFCLIL